MQSPHYRPAPNSTRRVALISLSIFGLMVVGIMGLWWTAAMKTPVVNIPNPVMPHPNAFDFYVKAGNAIVNDKQVGEAPGMKPTVPSTPAQKEALVQQNSGVINTLHQGFAYPYLNPPVRSFDAPFPYYAKFRGAARLLSLRGKVRAERGDWAGAADSYLDAMRIGEDIPHGSVLIGALVGIACRAIGRRPMWSTVDHLNAAQSRAVVTRLASVMDRHFSYADTLQEEKRYGQAGLLELFDNPKKLKAFFTASNDGADPGDTPAPTLSPVSFLAYGKSLIMRNYTTYMDAGSQQARKPYGLHLPPPPQPTDPFNQAVVPLFVESRLKDVAGETQDGLLLVTLALHTYRLEHGHYPASLVELTPSYLKKLPGDPFAVQGTFKYRIQGKSFMLYSVGPDGKDDGGTPIDDPKQAANSNPNARYFVNQNSVGDVVAGKNVW